MLLPLGDAPNPRGVAIVTSLLIAAIAALQKRRVGHERRGL